MMTDEDIRGLEKAEKEMASLQLVVLDATRRLESIEMSLNRIRKDRELGNKSSVEDLSISRALPDVEGDLDRLRRRIRNIIGSEEEVAEGNKKLAALAGALKPKSRRTRTNQTKQ